MAAWVLFSFLIVAFAHWVYRWRNPKCKVLLPPGSMGFPIIGESIQFCTSHSLQGIPPFIQQRMARYGSLFRTSIVGQKVIVSTDPEINHFIFQQEGKLVQCWYTESAAQITGPQGFTVHHGESHKYLRNLALNLVGPENLKESLLTEMDQTARQHLEQWTGLSKLDIKQATEIMLFKLIASKVLSYDEKKAMELRNYYKAFMEGFISFPLYVPGTSFYASMQGRKNAIKLIKETLNERRSSCNKKKNDFLDYILSEVDKEEIFLTEKIGVDVICMLIFAAYETTSSAITLALKFLNQHPHVLKQLQEEHENIIASREDKESSITWKEYRSMKFTHMVINETVRLANIAPGIFRKVVQDFQIKGYTIPKGWMFMICPSSVHLSAEKYDDPLSFNPSRWNGQELHAASKKFMAFGGGQRLCAGADFAKLAMSIMLHYLVTKYKWKVVDEGNIVRKPGLAFLDGFKVQIYTSINQTSELEKD
nr:cytochrome P450 family 87 subfamily A polypeptide 1 [Ipomoea batatas]